MLRWGDLPIKRDKSTRESFCVPFSCVFSFLFRPFIPYSDDWSCCVPLGIDYSIKCAVRNGRKETFDFGGILRSKLFYHRENSVSISGERFGMVQNGKNDEKTPENYFQTGKTTKNQREKSHNTTLPAWKMFGQDGHTRRDKFSWGFLNSPFTFACVYAKIS